MTLDGANQFDVAIVGGGVSGLYSAWRLLDETSKRPELANQLAGREGGKLRVAVFEWHARQRLGGRLFSHQLPGFDHIRVELGGMRYLNSHLRVAALVKKFGFATRELLVNDRNNTNLFYLRGQHFTVGDWGRPAFRPPYQLERGERSRSAGELLIEVALKFQSQASQMRNVGFWNLLLAEYSDEAYHLIREASGYESLVSNWSAAEAIPFLLADFDASAKYFALNDGYQALPLRLASEAKKLGAQVFDERRLYRLDDEGERIKLTFDTARCNFLNRQLTDSREEVYARHVVLAMPRRAIETLHPDSCLFDVRAAPKFQEDLKAVLPQPALKIFTAYRKPWWLEQRGVRAGRSVTDLPVRQCYYWQTGGKAPECDPQLERDDNLNSILMASYNDGASVEFWAGLARDSDPYLPPLSACPPGVPLPDPVPGLSMPTRMVTELQAQLRELHGLGSVQDPETAQIILPYAAVYQDWTQEPFGGGWHFWKIGVDARQVMLRMRQPNNRMRIYTCGEAWSSQQGWVEGALESADRVLEDVLGLPRPDWLAQEKRETALTTEQLLIAEELWKFARLR